MVTNSFFVYIPSNVRKEGNQTSSFTATLPKSLDFNSNWTVGLTSISYPISWLNFGSHSLQYIDIEWKNSQINRLYFPSSTIPNVRELEDQLKFGIANGYLCGVKEHERVKRLALFPGIEFDARESSSQRATRSEKKQLPPLRSDLLKGNEPPRTGVEDVSKPPSMPPLRKDLAEGREPAPTRPPPVESSKEVLEQPPTLDTQSSSENVQPTVVKDTSKQPPTPPLRETPLHGSEPVPVKTLPDSKDPLQVPPTLKTPEPKVQPSTDIPERTLPSDRETSVQGSEPVPVKTLPDSKDPPQVPPPLQTPEPIVQPSTAIPEREFPSDRETPLIGNEPPPIPILPPVREYDLKDRKRTFEKLLLPNRTDFQRQRQSIPDNLYEDISRLPQTNVHFNEQQDEYEFEENWDKCSRDPNLHLPSKLQIEYNASMQKFEIKFDESQIKSLTFSDQFSYILGLLKKRLEKSTLAEFMPELNGGLQNLYIYAPSLVEPTIVGDAMVPLLRIVKIKGSQGSMVEENFVNPEFRRLIDKNIREIRIEIRDNSGRLLNFVAGDILLTLNFRKILF